MVNTDASTRTPAKDAKGAVYRSDGLRRLTEDDIRVISYREEDLNNRDYCAKAGVVILLVVIVVAFITLFWHVVNR